MFQNVGAYLPKENVHVIYKFIIIRGDFKEYCLVQLVLLFLDKEY